MDVWLSYLVDQLKAYSPVCNFDLSEQAAPKVSSVFAYRPDMKRLRGKTLYLCPEGTDLGERELPADSYFVLPAGGEAPPNAICLDPMPDQDTLADLMIDSMERYRAWRERLLDLALSNAEPQQVLNAGSELLANPVLMLSASFALIGISPNATAQDFPFFDFEGTKRPVPEFLFSMNRIFTTRRYYHLDNNDLCRISAHPSGMLEVHYNICDDEKKPKVHVISMIRSHELTQGDLDLIFDFSSCLKKSLDISRFMSLSNTLSAYALDQVLLYGNPSTLQKLLDPKPGWQFIFGMYEESRETPRQNLNAMLRVQDVLPHSAAFIHNDRICFAACVSDHPADATYCTDQYQRIEAFAAAAAGLVGLSNPLPGPEHARDGLRQAERALHCASFRGPRPHAESDYLRFYADVALCDILEVFLDGKRPECYIPPEIAARYRADCDSGENHCEILYHYLLTGKSLAATSDAFHMHRNTVAYRIKRMKEVYGIQVDQSDKHISYLLACLICQIADRSRTGSAPPPDHTHEKR